MRAELAEFALGEHRQAVMTNSCAEALAAESGYSKVPLLQTKVDAALAELQEKLPALAFAEAVEEGRQRSLEELFLG